ncbi:MAG TPA: ABC transporter permease [Spirochaetia bacterium]|nr:ABC transporter permease [Spirochaetia bacterium]
MAVKTNILAQFSLQALRANKLRSFLTMLGIIIGVSSVILMIAIGQGTQAQVMARVNSLGSNVVIVSPGAVGQFGRGSGGAAQTLTDADSQAIAQLPSVANVAPSVGKSAMVTQGSESWTTTVTGTSPAIQNISSLSLAEGRFFSDDDNTSANAVAVLGNTTYEDLYATGANPVGTKISVGGVPFTVIGLLKSSGASAGGQDQDDVIYVPLKTAQIRLVGSTYVSRIELQATKSDQVSTLVDEVTTLLHRRHNLANGATNDFTVTNLSQILSTTQSVSRMLTLFLAGVAGISLLVGGIGIMNIMLVAVTERTREIGIRMSLGATRGDVLSQFLMEALLLSLAGSFVGVALGTIGAVLFSTLAKMTAQVSLLSILASVAFAALTGIFFGYYPARRAAALNPAEALSYE